MDIESRLVAAWGREYLGEGWSGEVGVSRCKLLHIERVNKVLLYSTENYFIQYPMLNLNGKEC